MKVAALDLGSNTSLLLIAKVEDGQLTTVYRDELTVTRMGQGVFESGCFHPEALARIDQTLRRYRAVIDREHCARVVAVATSAARDVANAAELFKIGQAHGIPIHIIEGEQEARLTFQGATGGLKLGPEDERNATVVDVGGGSTEIIRPGPRGQSFDIGSVRVSERFVKTDPISMTELNAVKQAAAKAFESVRGELSAPVVIAVAGTPTALATLDRGKDFGDWVHGYVLTRERVAEWATRLGTLHLAAREALPGMPPRRADVLVAGAYILLAALEALGAERLIVSTRGVRFGLAGAWAEFAP